MNEMNELKQSLHTTYLNLLAKRQANIDQVIALDTVLNTLKICYNSLPGKGPSLPSRSHIGIAHNRILHRAK